MIKLMVPKSHIHAIASDLSHLTTFESTEKLKAIEKVSTTSQIIYSLVNANLNVLR